MNSKRKFKTCYKILGILYAKTDNQRYRGDFKDIEWCVSAEEICQKLSITYEEYRVLTGLMYDREHLEHKVWQGKEHAYILGKGLTAYTEEEYKNEWLDRQWKRAEKIIIVVTVLIALLTLLYGIWSNKTIGRLEQRVVVLEDSLRLLNQRSLKNAPVSTNATDTSIQNISLPTDKNE